MGLAAFVPCRCWEEGRCKPPPDGYEIFRDPEVGLLDAVNSRDPNLPSEELDHWRYRSCEHEDGEYASEHISNWSGVAAFRDELSRLSDLFPVLLAEIPSVNGGSISPELASAALQELAAFERSQLGPLVRLVAVPTGEHIAKRVDAYDGVFLLDGRSGYDIGLDDSGLFIRSGATREVVFRSKRFTQSSAGEETKFTDIDSGRGVQLPVRMLGGAIELPPPSELKVVTGRHIPSDFEYITSPLRRIFEVSIRVGSPIFWC